MIRINLLAEIQEADAQRRRDPVKRAIWMGGGVVFLVLLFAGFLQVRWMQANSALEKAKGEWKKVEKDNQKILDNNKKTQEVDKKLYSLVALSTNRFLWGNTLDAVQTAMFGAGVENFQVTRIKGEQQYVLVAGVLAKTNTTGKVLIPSKKGSSTERITLTIEAKDYGYTEQNYNKFKLAVATNAYFKGLIPKPEESLRFKPFSAPTFDPTEPDKMYQTVILECQLPEVKRDE